MVQSEVSVAGEVNAGTWSVDVETWRVNWSPQARRIHAFTAERPVSVWEALDFIDLHDRARVFAATLECFRCGTPMDLEVGLTTAAGQAKRVRLTGFVASTPGGGAHSLKGTIRELPRGESGARSYDPASHRLLSALREWEIFGRAIPHELKGPLWVARGFAEALRDRESGSLSATGQRHLARAIQGLEQLGALLEGLLQFAPVATRPMLRESVSLSALAHDAIELLRARDPDRHVQVEIDASLTASGDQHLLRLLVANLLGNAWKFTRDRAVGTIRFGAQGTGAGTVYCVEDNGIGFDMRDAPRLFTPFERLHERHHYEGSGVGLAVVRRVVERHGGSVWAQSAPDAGASFFFTLAAGE